MSDDTKGGTWGEIARRGEFTMTVKTRARAVIQKYGHLHPKAMFLVEVNWNGINTDINFLTLEGLRDYCRDMQPREIVVWAAPAESNAAELTATLMRDAGRPLLPRLEAGGRNGARLH